MFGAVPASATLFLMFRGLSEITIIIPTVSRPRFVLRQFKYWGTSDAVVYILDGAAEAIDIPEGLRCPNVHYVHTGTRFNERLATAGQYVKTKYAALLCDDEFFAFNGLKAAVDHLESNPDVIGCVGRTLYFFVDQGRFLTSDAYREWIPFSDNATDLYTRLEEDLPPNKTHKAQFGVIRSPEWRSIFENSYRKFFSSGYTYERLINLQRTILGKTVILDELLWFRSMENPPISSVNVPRTGHGEFLNWARSSDFQDEVSEYRAIARRLLIEGGVSPADATTLEKRFFEGGVDRQAAKQALFGRRVKKRIRSILLSRTPKSLRLYAKRNLSNRMLSLSGWQGFPMDDIFRILSSKGTNYSREDIEIVQRLSLETAAEAKHISSNV